MMEGRKYLITFVALFLVQDVCGKIKVEGNLEDNKIVGGFATSINKFPWQILMLSMTGKVRHLCGGSILSSHYILTAGHCVKGIDKAFILAGITYRNNSNVLPLLPVETFQSHPRFNSTNFDYDIALLKLKNKLHLDGKKTKAVTLVKSGTKIPTHTSVIVTGWGTTSENGTLSNTLRAVKVSIISKDKCELAYNNSITDTMICAGTSKGGKDSCQGDSGGPIMLSSSLKQFGAVSFGEGCARKDKPGVYSDISKPEMRRWIHNVTGV